MPSGTFYPLSNVELAAIIAHLRRSLALPPVPRERHVTWLRRLALVTGKWETSVQEMDRTAPRWGELPRAHILRARALPGEHHVLGVPRARPAGGSVRRKSLARRRSGIRTRTVSALDADRGAAQRARLGDHDLDGSQCVCLLTDEEIDDLYVYLRANHSRMDRGRRGSPRGVITRCGGRIQ